MPAALPSSTRSVAITLPHQASFDNLVFQDRPLVAPKDDEILVRVRAVSLNSRDCQIASGSYPALDGDKDLIAGSDAAGDVVAVGGNVKLWKVGDRVAPIFSQGVYSGNYQDQQPTALGGGIDGVLTEYFKCSEQDVVKIPDHLTYVQACTSTITGVTSYHALFGQPGQALKPGETVLVLGTGGVSIYAAQLAIATGAKVIATSSSDEKLARLQKEVTSEIRTVNYSTHPEWEKEVLRLSEGRGVDHVIEIGGAATLPRSVRSCRRGGNVWVVGYLSAFQKKDESDLLAGLAVDILIKEVSIRGVVVGTREHYEELNRVIEATKLVPIVDQVFSFERVREAYRAAQKGAFGKVVIELA